MYIQLVCTSINTYALNLLNIQQSSFVAGIAYLQLQCSLQFINIFCAFIKNMFHSW